MEYTFFYGSIIALWIIFGICIYLRGLRLAHIIIGITTVAYSLVYEVILGEYFGLYYYITPEKSNLYIVLAGILVYPLLNIIYTIFLPEKIKPVLLYTGVWIIAMLLFEWASLITKTVVLLRWMIFPWSLLTYIVTYLWVYLFYRHLKMI
ncbi:hypothetical protein [Halonatronum saccharophilum]|uniref:hypothetical protein n=1 Tax=Halonatronum saccharophilum TaxID=150060 RepID=UPI000480B317|nr:hypothetical protein [Halonatronum saccharophilum]